jgi:hypothetical protein
MIEKNQNPGARAGATRVGTQTYYTECNISSAPKKTAITCRVAPHNYLSVEIIIRVSGRVLWALQQLNAAGVRGCTSITKPAPQGAAHVHTLRSLGLPIETINEERGGAFSGTHARYFLSANVAFLEKGALLNG